MILPSWSKPFILFLPISDCWLSHHQVYFHIYCLGADRNWREKWRKKNEHSILPQERKVMVLSALSRLSPIRLDSDHFPLLPWIFATFLMTASAVEDKICLWSLSTCKGLFCNKILCHCPCELGTTYDTGCMHSGLMNEHFLEQVSIEVERKEEEGHLFSHTCANVHIRKWPRKQVLPEAAEGTGVV